MPETNLLWLGLDVGSTTVKTAVVEPAGGRLLHFTYERHNARQAELTSSLLQEAFAAFPGKEFSMAVCGSGGASLAGLLGAPFIQEVVANSLAVARYYPSVNTAVELGGQDAKVVFFRRDERTNALLAHDMRMNGVCAGGTGAFIDQMAELLGVKAEEFDALATAGATVYEISGRCGVFAKTDVQPLLNQGVPKADIALSVLYAVAKQTIGGLSQGTEIKPPVIFAGGPLLFNKRLVKVFAEKLKLGAGDVVVPKRADVIVAQGAALSLGTMFRDSAIHPLDRGIVLERLKRYAPRSEAADASGSGPFFENASQKAEFYARHAPPAFRSPELRGGETCVAYLGIDAGSTTTKFVLLSEEGEVGDKYYSGNNGEPLAIIKQALIGLRDAYRRRGVDLQIKAVGVTGYGETLFVKGLKADFHTVETVAHVRAALAYLPDVSFILDIGGQDVKAIRVKDGVITGIALNEACAAGCGSFIETYAKSLNIPVERIADTAFASDAPAVLGSRCTVFMNSSIITAQRQNKTASDIMAGLCRSVVENIFTKVIRAANLDSLGDKIMVQGGTSKNDGVLRALELAVNKEITRPPHPGEMGAIGVARLTREMVKEREASGVEFKSRFIGLKNMEQLRFVTEPARACGLCANSCACAVVRFNHGEVHVTGNRCEKGEAAAALGEREAKARLRELTRDGGTVPDLLSLRARLVTADCQPRLVGRKKNKKIGIPLVLEFWNSLPFWRTLFQALGFEVVLSDRSSQRLYESGVRYAPSDTACFPAKLVHGHVQNLMKKRPDVIFMPLLVEAPPEKGQPKECVNMCAVIQGYPLVVRENDRPQEGPGIRLDAPFFRYPNEKLRNRQLADYFWAAFGLRRAEVAEAVAEADRAQNEFRERLREAGRRVLAKLERSGGFGVVVAARPYHSDELVNHGLPGFFTRLGVPVLTIDSLPDLEKTDLTAVGPDIVNSFHASLFSAALFVARHPRLEAAQIVSFGCGHDAVNTDEMSRILEQTAGKQLLVLKLDETDVRGPLSIRVRSFVETIRLKQKKDQAASPVGELASPFQAKFEKSDRRERTIYVPNLSVPFSRAIGAVLKRRGYRAKILPLADRRAVALGKKYVHNDICFPAQINVGEMLSYLEKSGEVPGNAALGLAKNCDGCRAGQYAMLARKALDEAGYSEVKLVTTGADTKGLHPGFKLGLWFQIGMVVGIPLIDALEDLLLKTRPYELSPGSTQAVYDRYVKNVTDSLSGDYRESYRMFEEAVAAFNSVPVDRSRRKPRVLVTGEILLNYHPRANRNIVSYFESHGLEVILPPIFDFFRRDVIRVREGARRHHLAHPFAGILSAAVSDRVYAHSLERVESRLQRFRFYEPRKSVHELAALAAGFMDKAYMTGEGWLIPTEIIHHAERGVHAFVIVQPFGCLPNHISGRGMAKRLKKLFPRIQILSLDYDPDVSSANLENRLQMLVAAVKGLEERPRAPGGRRALGRSRKNGPHRLVGS